MALTVTAKRRLLQTLTGALCVATPLTYLEPSLWAVTMSFTAALFVANIELYHFYGMSSRRSGYDATVSFLINITLCGFFTGVAFSKTWNYSLITMPLIVVTVYTAFIAFNYLHDKEWI